MARTIDNSDDMIDSREIIDAISDLEDLIEDLDSDIEDKQEEIDTFEYNDEDNPTEAEELALKDLESDLISFQKDKSLLQEELDSLQNLEDEFKDYCPDWRHGETLIRDSYFKEYAKQLADDLGLIDSNVSWPLNCIDWEEASEELQQDYTSGDFDGITYWAR